MLPAQFLVVHAGRKSRSILFTSRDGLEVWSGNMMQPEERGIVSLVLCPRRPGTGARWTEGLPRAYQDVCSPYAGETREPAFYGAGGAGKTLQSGTLLRRPQNAVGFASP